MRTSLLPLLTLGLLGLPSMTAAADDKKPNIVLLFADDLGYHDLGCQGGKEIPTPNIDSIAKNGVRCTSGYVSCPVCSPTRAGMMTGRYQTRFGHEFNPGPANQADKTFGLPLTETTVANRLKKLGYATGLVGKWHLGYNPEYVPTKRGFDEFFGFLGGAHSYVDARADMANPIYRGTEKVDEKEYLTEAFAREAVAYIDRHKKEPFFLYLAFNAVHNPLQAPKKYLDRFEKVADEKRKTYSAMLSALDDAVGEVLKKLRDEKLEDNTLIFFISDNGGPTQATTSKNDPLSGRKGQVWEGGIRVPFMVQWKAKLPGGKVYDKPVIALDMLPTTVVAAGGEVAADWKLDGVNLVPYLDGKKDGVPHERLFWRYGEQHAVRQGKWKLLKEAAGEPKLFDLDADIGEKKDLAKDKPEVFKELAAAYKAWDAQLAKPLWGRRGAQPE